MLMYSRAECATARWLHVPCTIFITLVPHCVLYCSFTLHTCTCSLLHCPCTWTMCGVCLFGDRHCVQSRGPRLSPSTCHRILWDRPPYICILDLCMYGCPGSL